MTTSRRTTWRSSISPPLLDAPPASNSPGGPWRSSSSRPYLSDELIRNATRDFIQMFRGRRANDVGPEREADYIAALILYRSGIDPDKARGFLVTMARASGRKETGMLD